MKLVAMLAAVAALGAIVLIPSPASAKEDYDCSDFATQAEAQEYLLPGDPYGLDADNDGIACEDLPCPCAEEGSGGGGGSESTEPPPPPPYHLTKAAARHAAWKVARKFTRRNPRVTQTRLGVCNRLAERWINCLATARGRTRASQTLCHMRIAVRAENRHPSASLARSQCRTRRLPLLTYERARTAIRARGAELAGKPVGLGALERLSRTVFRGLAIWKQLDPSGTSREECFSLMDAKLDSFGEVATVEIESGCEPVFVA